MVHGPTCLRVDIVPYTGRTWKEESGGLQEPGGLLCRHVTEAVGRSATE